VNSVLDNASGSAVGAGEAVGFELEQPGNIKHRISSSDPAAAVDKLFITVRFQKLDVQITSRRKHLHTSVLR
jgi:hypothetical protein